MGLVSHAAFGGDFTQGLLCRKHEPLRALHAAPDDISVRRFADTVAERHDEVELAEANECGEIFVSQGRFQVHFDMRHYSANLPWRESPAGAAFMRAWTCTTNTVQQGLRALQAGDGPAAFVTQSLIQRSGQ